MRFRHTGRPATRQELEGWLLLTLLPPLPPLVQLSGAGLCKCAGACLINRHDTHAITPMFAGHSHARPVEGLEDQVQA